MSEVRTHQKDESNGFPWDPTQVPWFEACYGHLFLVGLVLRLLAMTFFVGRNYTLRQMLYALCGCFRSHPRRHTSYPDKLHTAAGERRDTYNTRPSESAPSALPPSRGNTRMVANL